MSKKGFLTEYIFPKVGDDIILFRKGEKRIKVNV